MAIQFPEAVARVAASPISLTFNRFGSIPTARYCYEKEATS